MFKSHSDKYYEENDEADGEDLNGAAVNGTNGSNVDTQKSRRKQLPRSASSNHHHHHHQSHPGTNGNSNDESNDIVDEDEDVDKAGMLIDDSNNGIDEDEDQEVAAGQAGEVNDDEDAGYSDDVESGELVRQEQQMMEEAMMGGRGDDDMIDEYDQETGDQYDQDPDYFGHATKKIKPDTGKIKFKPQLPAHSNKISHHLGIKQQQGVPSPAYSPYSATNLFAQLNPASANSTTASNSGKIFHVDAYCYLCKKEFCNKYFLRTHLANKHKVGETTRSRFNIA